MGLRCRELCYQPLIFLTVLKHLSVRDSTMQKPDEDCLSAQRSQGLKPKSHSHRINMKANDF
ncbi:hypothetical protein LZ30DRAFT_708450 [Colletotrichum cereale]|nr:hypothetical protein LZ30DRAFT_708450 [Colletotrichum cereale]